MTASRTPGKPATVRAIGLHDDLDGSPATEQITFGFNGETYEINVNAKHAAEIRAKLAPYIKGAAMEEGAG